MVQFGEVLYFYGEEVRAMLGGLSRICDALHFIGSERRPFCRTGSSESCARTRQVPMDIQCLGKSDAGVIPAPRETLTAENPMVFSLYQSFPTGRIVFKNQKRSCFEA